MSVKIGSVVFAVGDDKKKGKGSRERNERKGTKSHVKRVIFHLFVGREPPVNRF